MEQAPSDPCISEPARSHIDEDLHDVASEDSIVRLLDSAAIIRYSADEVAPDSVLGVASPPADVVISWLMAHPRVRGVYAGTARASSIQVNSARVPWVRCDVEVSRTHKGTSKDNERVAVIMLESAGSRCVSGQQGVFFLWDATSDPALGVSAPQISGTLNAPMFMAVERYIGRWKVAQAGVQP